MNARSNVMKYDRLTPQERFSLILSAGARGDDAEQQRLTRAATPLYLSMPDHSPWLQAFDEIATVVLLELLEEAAKHDDAFQHWCETEDDWNDEHRASQHLDEESDEEMDEEGEDDEEVSDEAVDGALDETARAGVVSKNTGKERTLLTRTLDVYLARGFILKTKLMGWKLFCERLSIPAFALWEPLPGWARLERAMQLLEDNEFRPAPAFKPEGMLRWLNRIRPAGDTVPSMETLISSDRFAADLERCLHLRVQWWGGKS